MRKQRVSSQLSNVLRPLPQQQGLSYGLGLLVSLNTWSTSTQNWLCESRPLSGHSSRSKSLLMEQLQHKVHLTSGTSRPISHARERLQLCTRLDFKSRSLRSGPHSLAEVALDGAVAEYNARCVAARHPEDAICRGDELLEVNGAVWDSELDSLLKNLRGDDMLFMVLRRREPQQPQHS